MLGDITDEIKTKLDSALKTAIWGAVAAAAGTAGGLFLLTALFIWVAAHYNTTVAALVLGGIFVFISIVALVIVLMQRQAFASRAVAQRDRQARTPTWLFDPALATTGLQIIRVLGGKRSTMLLIAAITLGWLLSRPSTGGSNRSEKVENRG